jgi:hypothetical protein
LLGVGSFKAGQANEIHQLLGLARLNGFDRGIDTPVLVFQDADFRVDWRVVVTEDCRVGRGSALVGAEVAGLPVVPIELVDAVFWAGVKRNAVDKVAGLVCEIVQLGLKVEKVLRTRRVLSLGLGAEESGREDG